MIEGETIFRSTSNEEERRQLFDEYILELRKAEQDRETRNRKDAIDDLVGLLKSLDMEPYTRWSCRDRVSWLRYVKKVRGTLTSTGCNA